MNIKVGIITAADKGYAGERKDESGPEIKRIVEEKGYEVIAAKTCSDDIDMLKEALIDFSDHVGCDLILTTGGTGFTPRDNTPEATMAVVEKLTPGFGEAMRAESMKITPRGMLSRATSGIRGRTLIINLPGSVKAARECLNAVIDALEHAVEMINGGGECASRFNEKK